MPAKIKRIARGAGPAGESFSDGPRNRQARKIETAPIPRNTPVQANPAHSSAKTIQLSAAAPTANATSGGAGSHRRQSSPSAYAQARANAPPSRIRGTVSNLVGDVAGAAFLADRHVHFVPGLLRRTIGVALQS